MKETERMQEIVRYLQGGEVSNPNGQHVHVHYHQAPVDTRPVDQNAGQNVLERYTPYFIVGLFGCIILAIVAAVVVIAAPALMAIAAAGVGMVLAVAVGCIAVSAAVRNMRETPRKEKRKK